MSPAISCSSSTMSTRVFCTIGSTLPAAGFTDVSQRLNLSYTTVPGFTMPFFGTTMMPERMCQPSPSASWTPYSFTSRQPSPMRAFLSTITRSMDDVAADAQTRLSSSPAHPRRSREVGADRTTAGDRRTVAHHASRTPMTDSMNVPFSSVQPSVSTESRSVHSCTCDGGQRARVREDRTLRIVEAERRIRPRQHQVRVVVRRRSCRRPPSSRDAGTR